MIIPGNLKVVMALFLHHCLILGFVLLIAISSGCAQKQHGAATRSYKRDLANGQKYYVVKTGDTLFSIGIRSGKGYKRLAEWNNISQSYKIISGQTIKLFNPAKKSQKHNKTIHKKESSSKKRGSSQKWKTNSNKISTEKKINWQWPIKGKILKTYSQSGNKGIDINGRPGQLIKAAAKGKVVYSGHGLIGYGNLLIIKHSEQYLSAYANNRRLLVKEGQKIQRGQEIAEIGKGAGNNTTLHFEIRRNGKPIDPMKFLPK